jgi:DNA-binding MarR family transcriptional regulator
MPVDQVSEPLDLEQFLPYRFSVLANRVSRAFARLYEARFDLKLPEWRVMAVLGRRPGITAREVTEMTAMDKVAISRALSRLQSMGRVVAREDEGDRRRQLLTLSDQGVEIYRQIVPLAKRIEAELIAELPPEDRAALDRLLSRLTRAAEKIDRA